MIGIGSIVKITEVDYSSADPDTLDKIGVVYAEEKGDERGTKFHCRMVVYQHGLKRITQYYFERQLKEVTK